MASLIAHHTLNALASFSVGESAVLPRQPRQVCSCRSSFSPCLTNPAPYLLSQGTLLTASVTHPDPPDGLPTCMPPNCTHPANINTLYYEKLWSPVSEETEII